MADRPAIGPRLLRRSVLAFGNQIIASFHEVVILAGELGTRISEESNLKPKPMIEIGGKPILWHIMKILFGARRQRLRDLLRLQGLRHQGIFC